MAGAIVATARTVLTVDDRTHKRGLKQAERDVDTFGRSAASSLASYGKAIALTAGAAGVGALILGTKKAITAASDLGEQVNKAKVVFRGSEAGILSWAKTTALAFGISNRAALEAVGTFGNMLVPMGFARSEAAEMSKTMVELAADMASFNNASPEDVLLALRSGLAGETEPLRKFGIFLNQARIEQEALNLGLYDGKGALSASAKAAATYAIILKDTKDAQGDFGRTSGSLANQTRILRAQLEDAAAKAGKLLLPAVTSLITQFNGLITRLQRSKEAQRFLNDAMEMGSGVIRGVVKAARDLAPTLLSVARATDRMAKALGGWDDVAKVALGVWIFGRLAALRSSFVATAGAQGIGAATTAISGRGGLAGALKSLPRTVKIAIVLVGVVAAYKALKELFGMLANLEGTKAGAGVQQKGGRWVLSADGTTWTWFWEDGTRGPTRPAGKGRPKPLGGEDIARAAIQGGGGRQVGSPGGGTHSRTERGYIWQDDDAWDIEVQPTTIIVAVDEGQVGGLRYGGDKGRFSGWGFTLYGKYGTYFYKHLRDIFLANGQYVERGQPVGRGSTTGHLHFAKKGAGTAPKDLPPTETPTGGGPAVGSGKTRGGASDKPPDTTILPLGLELRLAKAELTKRLSDDLEALQAIVDYLEARRKKEKDVNKRLEIIRELKTYRDQLARVKDEMDGDEDGTILPSWLLKKLTKAESTERLQDDLKANELIQRYLMQRLRDDEKNAKLLEELLKVQRRIRRLKKLIAREKAAQERERGKKAADEAEEAIAEPEPAGPEDEQAKYRPPWKPPPLTGKETTAELKAMIDNLKAYRKILIEALKKVDKKIAAVKRTITRLLSVPPRRRNANWRAQLNAAVKKLEELRQDRIALIRLIAVIDESIADLAEAANAQPDPEGADGGSGEEPGEEPDEGEDGGDSGESAREIAERNILAFLGARTDLMRSYASNVIAAAFAGQLGALPGGDPYRPGHGGAPGKGSNVTVNNYYPTPPVDPHTWSKQLEFELKMGMG